MHAQIWLFVAIIALVNAVNVAEVQIHRGPYTIIAADTHDEQTPVIFESISPIAVEAVDSPQRMQNLVQVPPAPLPVIPASPVKAKKDHDMLGAIQVPQSLMLNSAAKEDDSVAVQNDVMALSGPTKTAVIKMKNPKGTQKRTSTYSMPPSMTSGLQPGESSYLMSEASRSYVIATMYSNAASGYSALGSSSVASDLRAMQTSYQQAASSLGAKASGTRKPNSSNSLSTSPASWIFSSTIFGIFGLLGLAVAL